MHTTVCHFTVNLGQSGTWKNGDNDKLTDNKLPELHSWLGLEPGFPTARPTLFPSLIAKEVAGCSGVKSITWKCTSTWSLRKWLCIKLGLCRCNYGQECDEVTLCPKSNECPHKRKKRTQTEKTMQKWKQSDGSASSGMPRPLKADQS